MTSLVQLVSFSTSPELDIQNIKKLIALIESNQNQGIKELVETITWKEKQDSEIISYINENPEIVKDKLESYKLVLKLKLEKLELYSNALTKDKETLNKILNLINELNQDNLIDTCSSIGDLMKGISWKEDNPEYIRNKHGFRSRWMKKPNKLNADGAKINFEILSHLKYIRNQNDWIQDLLRNNFNTIKSAFECLKNKINIVLNGSEIKQDGKSLDQLVRFMAFIHIKECMDKLKLVFAKLSNQREKINLKDKIHRFYLGYLLVNIGETTNEIIQCIKPEIIEGKQEEASTQIEIMFKYLKQCRKLIKAKPEHILTDGYVLEFIKNKICSCLNSLIEIFNDFELNIVEFIKASFESSSILDRFMEFNRSNQQKLENIINSLDEITKTIKKPKIERLFDHLKDQLVRDNVDFDRFKTSILEQYNKQEKESSAQINDNFNFKIKKLNRLLYKLMNKFELSELNQLKLDNLDSFLNEKLKNPAKLKKSDFKQLSKELKKLLDLWTSSSSNVLEYLKNESKVGELTTVESFLNAIKNLNLNDDKIEDDTVEPKKEIKLKQNYTKPDGLEKKLKRLDAWDFLSQLRDFDQIPNDNSNTKKFILNICIIVNEAIFYDDIQENADKSFQTFEHPIECKKNSLKMSFAIIGQLIKEVFREANLNSDVMKYYKHDTLFDYSNLSTVILRNKIMHNDQSQTNSDGKLEEQLFFSCWVKTIKSLLFILLQSYDDNNKSKILYEHFIEKEISDYLMSLDENVEKVWRTFLLMQCYNRLTAYGDTVRLFEKEQEFVNSDIGLLLPRIYDVYFDALTLSFNYGKIIECFQTRIKYLDEKNEFNKELKTIAMNFYNDHLLANINPERINLNDLKKETICEKKLLHCFYCIEKGFFERALEILMDINLNSISITNAIFARIFMAKCFRHKGALKNSLRILNEALELFNNKKNDCIRIFGGFTRVIETEIHTEIASNYLWVYETTWDNVEDLDNAYNHAYLATLICEGSSLDFDLLSYATSCALIATVYARKWVLNREPSFKSYIKSYTTNAVSSLKNLTNYSSNSKVAFQLFSLCLICEQVGEFDAIIGFFSELLGIEALKELSYVNSVDLNNTMTISQSLILLLETRDFRVYSELCEYCYGGSNSETVCHLSKLEEFFVRYQGRFRYFNVHFELSVVLAYINAYKCKHLFNKWEKEENKEIKDLHEAVNFSIKAANLIGKTETGRLTKAKFFAIPAMLYLKFKSIITDDAIIKEMNENFDGICKMVSEFPLDNGEFDNLNDVIDYALIVEQLYTLERYKEIYKTKLFEHILSICSKISSIC